MAGTYIEQLTDFVVGLQADDIPADVQERVGFFLLDAIGVALANRDKPFVRLQANVVNRTVKDGACTVIGQRETYVPEGAAQLNSIAVHGTDFDATHLTSIMHTSTVIFPTALAVAEEVNATGTEFATAVVGGAEVLIRMGEATKGAMHRLGFQSTALCAPVMLAMVAGRLFGMKSDEIVSAAGMAASMGAGLRAFADDGTWGKRVITGWSCRAGLFATALAREGYPGTKDALEKEPFGLYKAFVQNGEYDLSELTRGLGSEWMFREIDFKRYPCSHGHHAFLDTVRRARQELNLNSDDVDCIMLHVSAEARKWWFEPHERKYELPNSYGARFSMPYTTALVLEYGNLYDEHLDDMTLLQSPRIKQLVARVQPKIDKTLSNTNPVHPRGTIEIKTKDGRVTKFEGAGHVSSGDAFKDAVLEKYHLNVAKLEATMNDDVVTKATKIASQPDVRSLMRLLRL